MWLNNTKWTIPLIVVTMTWKSAGSTALIYMASISGISADLYEAATIDGASIWQRIRHITLPSINGLARTLLIMQVISVFQILYEPMVLKNGGPNNASISLMMLVYRFAFRDSDFSGAAALSVMICIILIILSGLYMKVAKKKRRILGGEGMFFRKYFDKRDGAIRGYDMHSPKSRALSILIMLLCIVMVIAALFPVVWVFLASFKDIKDFTRNVTIIPQHFDFEGVKRPGTSLNFPNFM